jgi:hypothetical protein
MTPKKISRRKFLTRLGVGAATLAMGSKFSPQLFSDEPSRHKSRVVVVTNLKAIHHYDADTAEVTRSFNRGLLALTGADTVEKAWLRFVAPTDIIGLKISTLGGAAFSTRPELVNAIVEGLRRAGVPLRNIILWDKNAEAMKRSRLASADSPNEPLRLATFPREGYDPEIFYESNFAGKLAWDDHEFGKTELGTRSYYSRILTKRITKLICLPMMTDSREAGLAGALYTMATGAVDNTRRFAGRPAYFDPAAAEICAHPVIKDKWCLTIADGLVAQYLGGPAFHPQYCWHHAALYLSADPVAVDALMLEEIERMRKRAEIPPIGEIASHIQTAAAYGLGESDPARIEKLAVQM